MSSLTNAKSATPATYLDLVADVKPWLQIPATSTLRDANITLITEMACSWVAGYTGRSIGATTHDRRFDGWASWQGAYIMLPFYPVLEIVSMTEYWGIAGPHVLVESTPTLQVDGFQCVYPTGRLNRVFPGNVQKPFFPGSRNIEVVWVAGYNPIPADIKMATLELIAHWYRNTQLMGAKIGNAISAQNEFEPASTAGGLWQGVPYRVTALLQPYLSIGMG